MSKPRILIVENSVAVTGALKSILRSSLYLREWYDFIFVLPKGSESINLVTSLAFPCIELPMKEIRKDLISLIIYLPYLLANTIRLRKLLLSINVTLIVNNDFYNLLPFTYRFLGGKIPYVNYVRFLPSKFPQLLMRFWSACHDRYAARVLAVSNAVKNELPHKKNVVVIGNELPQMEEFEFAPSDSTLILYPSNYIRGKGHEYALESFARISKKYPQWKLRFVGGDMGLKKNKAFKESLIRRSNELGLTDRIEWLGFASEMGEQYGSAAIILNFSESESFSLTCLEGMFYGRAVIATDSGGPSEIIDRNETGLIVDVGDVAAMSKALETLIGDPAMRHRLSENAYSRIRIKFSNQKITEELHEVYQAVLDKKMPNF